MDQQMKKIKLKLKKKTETLKEEPESTIRVLCPNSKNNRCKGQKYGCPHSTPHNHSESCTGQCSLLSSLDRSFKCMECGD